MTSEFPPPTPRNPGDAWVHAEDGSKYWGRFGAAGGVGTMVGQIARLLGAARVVGSAGSAEKVELLTSKYGYDAAFNYRDGDIAGQLEAAAPDGIDNAFTAFLGMMNGKNVGKAVVRL